MKRETFVLFVSFCVLILVYNSNQNISNDEITIFIAFATFIKDVFINEDFRLGVLPHLMCRDLLFN